MAMENSKWKQLLNKVPEVTIYFWVIKILCTTVGETFADYLNAALGLGLSGTSLVMGILLAIVLIFQFRSQKYIPTLYWLSVVLISVVGTLITDNLTDNLGISLMVSSIIFAGALAITFIIWYVQEKSLSVHTIVTRKREAFYWLAILCTFALGTAVGDLIAETWNVGYLLSVGLFALFIAVTAFGYYKLKWNSVLSFWIAYILTRPLGASIGDYLSQTRDDGGLGLGTTVTSAIFIIAILALVIYLTRTKKDVVRGV